MPSPSPSRAAEGTEPVRNPAAGAPGAEEPLPESDPLAETGDYVETGGSQRPDASPGPDVVPGGDPKPPPIVLTTQPGRHQEAVQGSYCVTDPQKGVGVCADTAGPIHPKELSVVAPGDAIRFEIADADLRVPEGSAGAASTVTVYPLGCAPNRSVTSFELTSTRMHWSVDLEPGAYELGVFAYFETEAGATGDTFGVLGLLVDPEFHPDRDYAMPAAKDPFVVCPYPEQP